MADKPPRCRQCQMPLVRVDRLGIEHLTLDEDVYREVHALEGIASEVQLRCGRCHAGLTKEQAAFFYKGWIKYVMGESHGAHVDHLGVSPGYQQGVAHGPEGHSL